jgi:hypothetical protein
MSDARRSFALLAAVALFAGACGTDSDENTDPELEPDAAVDTGPDPAPDTGETGTDGEQTGLQVSSVQPPDGTVDGGTSVAISGTGFEPDATVYFGDREASDASVVSDFQIEAKTPSSETAGPVDVRVELGDGTTATLSDGFEYTGDPGPDLETGWCTLQFPSSLTGTVGTKTDPMFGRVYVEGCTDGEQHCDRVEAELGLGDPTTDPSANPEAYNWMAAEYNPDHTSDNNDEYQSLFTPQEVGTRAYVYRFKLPEESSWSYCDLDGSSNGFQTDQMGELVVEEDSTPEVEIGWCNLQYPPSITVGEGNETPNVYGRVYVEGCTKDDSDGRVECEPVSGQVGWGPTDVDPSTSPADYQWVEASYNDQFPSADQDSNNDEHQATLTPDATGEFNYTFRFSGDGGDSWTYCDQDGSPPFSADQLGTLTVE